MFLQPIYVKHKNPSFDKNERRGQHASRGKTHSASKMRGMSVSLPSRVRQSLYVGDEDDDGM